MSHQQSLEIRRAQESDVLGVGALLLQVCNVHAAGRPDLFRKDTRKYSDDELRVIFADDAKPVFVAVDGDHVLGHAFCIVEDLTHVANMPPHRTLYIDDICVDEAARGRKVGTALYEHVHAYARANGFYNVTLNVWSCNPGAMKFYEAMGLKPFKIGMEQVL